MIKTGFSAALAALLLQLPAGCNTATPPVTSGESEPEAEHSILQLSSPAPASSVTGPLDQLDLWFDPPARLLEVTVTGADGMTMPMMVTSVGETSYYSIPLPSLSTGSYSVRWRANVGGEAHRGSFQFNVT